MTLGQGLGAIAILWLLLLARSAWKQGELGQFLRALLAVAVLIAAVSGIVAGWIWLDRG